MNILTIDNPFIKKRGEQLFTTSVAADPGLGRLKIKSTSSHSTDGWR